MNAPCIGNFLNSWALILKIDTERKKKLINAYGNVFRTRTVSTLFAELAVKEFLQSQISFSELYCSYIKKCDTHLPETGLLSSTKTVSVYVKAIKLSEKSRVLVKSKLTSYPECVLVPVAPVCPPGPFCGH